MSPLLKAYSFVAGSQRSQQTKSQRSQLVYLLSVTEAKGSTDSHQTPPRCMPALLLTSLVKIENM
jgi:hypothetical protein